MPVKRYILFFIIVSLLVSCRVSKPPQSSTVPRAYATDYIYKYKDLAVSEMRRSGIPASITLAQGMLESDYGRSRLATEANNHFGIKCHNGWTGATIRHHDDRRNECFRKYRKAEESYYDHSDFLTSASRYSSLFDLARTDYRGWAKGLKKAGYATNPDYANLLIRKIEEYELWKYDQTRINYGRKLQKVYVPEIPVVSDSEAGSGDTSMNVRSDNFVVPVRVSRIKENNRIKYIVAIEGDTREGIEKEFNLLKWELSKYNELESNFNIVSGQILYLQPKRNKAEHGKEVHTVTPGDTMYSVSQKYGIKLKKLYELNRMSEGEEPKEGDRLWLRSMKPVI